MKNMTFLFILLLPTAIFTQSDDYCPCMENSNPLINVMNMVSSLDDIGVDNFVYQGYPNTSNLYIVNENLPVYPVTNTIEQSKIKEHGYSISQQKSISVVDLKSKKTRFKFGKKSHTIRLKPRRKVRKYRGKCPSF